MRDNLLIQLRDWRIATGVREGAPTAGVATGDVDLVWSSGSTVSLAVVIAADGGPPEEIEIAEALARLVSARQLTNEGQFAVTCFLIHSGFELSERWYRLLLDASVHPIDWADDWARRNMTELTFRQGPSGNDEIDPGMSDPPGDCAPEPKGSADSILPHDLRIFWEEEPDFQVQPITLEGLTGRRLTEKKLQLARAYLGFLPELFPQIRVPMRIELPEVCVFLLQTTLLVEHRQARPSTRIGVGSRIAPGMSLWTSTSVGIESDKLTEIDRGDVVITNRRIVFVGARQTREWRLDKLLSAESVPIMDHSGFRKRQEQTGSVISLRVSNRQKVSGFAVDTKLTPTIEFMIDLALADQFGEREQLVLRLAKELHG